MKLTILEKDINTGMFITPHGHLTSMEVFLFNKGGVEDGSNVYRSFEVVHEMADRLISGAWFKEIDEAIVEAQSSIGENELVVRGVPSFIQEYIDPMTKEEYIKYLENKRHKIAVEVLVHMMITLAKIYVKSGSLKDTVLLFIKELKIRDEIRPEYKLEIQKLFDFAINTEIKELNRLRIKEQKEAL